MLRFQVSSKKLREQDPNTDPSNFVVNFNQPIQLGSLNYKLALAKVETWNTNPNCVGNSIAYTLNGSPFTLAIPNGQYGISDLNAVFKEELEGRGADIGSASIVANENTNRVVIELDSSVDTVAVDLTASGNIAHLLGFDEVVVSATREGDRIANITNSVDTWQVKCDVVNGSYSNGTVDQIIFNFAPTVPTSSFIEIEPLHLIYMQVNTSIISSMRFELVDNLGRPIDLAGEDVVYTILIEPL